MEYDTKSIGVFDNFLEKPDAVRQSALNSGFGSWCPHKGQIGSSIYDGINFYGDHATVLETIYKKVGFVGCPNSMFFRVTNETTERAYVHSDIYAGDITCLVYLSKHDDMSGTGFYRHKQTGMISQPKVMTQQLIDEINDSSDKYWEQVYFVEGKFNRAVIFKSDRFHRRTPEHGFGTDENTGRMVYAVHFRKPQIGV